MKRTIKALYLVCASLCLSSCGSEQDDDFRFSGPDRGGLILQMPVIDTADPVIISRAADFTRLDPADFIIEIYPAGESDYYVRYETYTDMQAAGTLELPVGDYIVKAFSHDPAAVEQEAPYFYGEAALRIESYEISRIAIECRYASLGVEIVLTDAFLSFFRDDYQITVEQDTGVSASVTRSNPGRIYFSQACMYLKVTIECTTRQNETYPSRVYYFNREGEDPEFGEDGPFIGEYFILTIDTDNAAVRSL